MIELKTGYSLSQVPYITYEALDSYAEAVIRDFDPERLYIPGPVNAEGFVEYYLGLPTRYRRISYDRRVLAMTAFNNGFIQVIDEDTGFTEPMPVTTGTVIVDTSLTARRNLARLRFTVMHEGAHWLLHRDTFAADNPFGSPGTFENQYLEAKEGRIDYSRSQKERTDSERIERQADFLASALLMPRPALRNAFRSYFGFYDERPRRIVRGASALDNCFAAQLPEYVAGVFQVSKRAALIRLEKLTAIVDKGCQYYG
ncbi:MAG: ImmA/IrrE family metallo-endopeptidase [Christensenellaceae bacterium]|jgi:Zn-dependent peptidase ImmA (M78 family)|nr:ImmA/IrrE family metallo-endopeptidase [Christensenellaceae bacterium]